MWLFGLLLFLIGLFISYFSWKRCKNGCFYSDTHLLGPLGIFVWGDGLILGPFWALSGLLFTFQTPLIIVRYLLLFWSIRCGYEVVYWLTHQAAKSDYEPPLFRKVSWLNAGQAAILYQLLNTLGLFISLFGLLYSFS